jgi:hypothetical protein
VLLYGGYFLVTLAPAVTSGSLAIAVVVVGLVDLLVGFSDETLFGGILLRGEMEYRNVFEAMLVSAVVFALFHLTNIFHAPVNEVMSQIFSALMFGLCMAPLVLLVGNLTPLVIWHFIWDFVQETPSLIPELNSTASPFEMLKPAMPFIKMVMIVVGWVAVFVLWRRERFSRNQVPDKSKYFSIAQGYFPCE